MKHFRDLVLSTKEPALHNVLWIEPKKDENTGKYVWGEYLVKMFEDGWKVLFGGGGEGSNGLGFVILNPRTGLTQLYDVRDPDNHKEIYPVTKATNVYLSNTVDVETAINNINQQLKNMSSTVRKAIFAMDDMIDNWEVSKVGKTFWVYSQNSALESDGYFTGEPFLRKYTTNSSYTRETLYLSDIVMAIDDEISGMQNTRMWYVNIITPNNARLMNIADYKDLIQLRSSLNSTYLQDIQIDGVSITNQVGSTKVASISDDVRPVYMIDYANLETFYPGNSKKDKTFFFKQGENNLGRLARYTSATQYEEIVLREGDLLYNLDNNFEKKKKGLYVVIKEGNHQGTILLIPNVLQVQDMLYQGLSDVSDNVKPVYIDFEIGQQEGTSNPPIYRATTDYTVEQIVSYYNSGRTIYARLSNPYDIFHTMPIILPLLRTESELGSTVFSGVIQDVLYDLSTINQVEQWQLRRLQVQQRLTFDERPTQGSSNPVTSDAVYAEITSLQQDLSDCVLLNGTKQTQTTSYNNRMATTPKYHRAEWITNNTGGIIDPSPSTAESRFESMWWAIYNNHTTTHAEDNYTPKVILFNGVPACFNDTDSYTRPSDASSFTLKFFDGQKVTTYVVTKDTNVTPMVLRVTTTVQNVTLT